LKTTRPQIFVASYLLSTFTMMKSLIVVAASVAFAFEDDGLSLLQLRAQKHESVQEELQVTVQGVNTLCPPEEVLTFAQCVEVQQKQIVPNNHQSWSLLTPFRGHGWRPTGCVKNPTSGLIAFNDEPETGRGFKADMPICSPSGGRAAEIAAGLTGKCEAANCVKTTGFQKLAWGPEVAMPEISVGPVGTVCELGSCALLDYKQCQQAGDMHLADSFEGALPTANTRHFMELGLVGPGHTVGTRPSGCVVDKHGNMGFSPTDTPDGAAAGLVTASGVGIGTVNWFPVCAGTCTTTTTAPPPMEDEAGAIGDPHLHTAYGAEYDYSLEDGK